MIVHVCKQPPIQGFVFAFGNDLCSQIWFQIFPHAICRQSCEFQCVYNAFTLTLECIGIMAYTLHVVCFSALWLSTLFLHSLAHALQLSAATWIIRGICALHPQRNILNVTSSTYHRQRSILNATSSMPHPQRNMYMNVNIPPHPQPLTSSTKNQP